MYVSGRVDIFDMVDIDLFTVVALNMMVLKLGYTGESEPMFYNYLRPLTSLDEGLYALACEEDVRCLATLVRSFKLIEVYIEHGVTVLDSYLRAPRFRATLEDITDEPAGSIAANRTEKMLLLTWHESSETTKEPVCDSVTPSSLPQHDSSTPCKDSVLVYMELTHKAMFSPTIQSQFSDINLSFVTQQATASQVIDDVMRKLSFDETELDGEAGFADVAGSGVDSSGLSHDESFGVDDLDLNLNGPVNLNVSQVETQSELPMSEEPDVSTEAPIVEEVGTQEFSVEDVVIKDYVSSGEDGEDAEQGNGQEDESARTDREFFYDDEGIDIAYETEYDVQSSEDVGTDDDDVDEYFLVDEENEIVEPDVDVYLYGISMDLPFDNIGITNLVPDDVLEGEDVDVINADGFDNDLGNDEERNYRKKRLAELRTEMEGVINASDKFTQNWVVKTHKDTHTCLQSREIKHCTYKFLSEKIFEQVRVNPDIPVKAVDHLQCKLEVQISMSKAFKAKAKAEREIRGDHVLQYSMLRDYVVELQSTNPNTTVKIEVERNTDPSLPTRGPFSGQVLVAVGLDSNNGIYQLAYALVETESKSSWCWFLWCLSDDIDLHPNSNFTFITDRQKGIIPAIKTIYPSAEHKYCLRHIHENIKQGWCGQEYKDLLWRAASATNVRDFEKCMLELKTMNPKAHEWLNKIPAEHWARSHFSGRAKSDLLLNNICEVFNGKIVGGRDKPVITLLEIMESIKKEAHLMKVQWNGENKYRVSSLLGDQCVVDVVSMTCSCRKWELTGIPCKHVVAACWNMALNDRAAPPLETWVGRQNKKIKRSKHEDEPFVKDGKLSRKGRTITCQSCGNTGHNKATCKGQSQKATTGGNNAEAGSSASRQAQQTKPAVGQDGSGGSGVARQGSSRTRWTKIRVQIERISLQKTTPTQPASQPSTSSQVSVSQTRNADGREMGDGVLTQSSATGGASEWSFL
ncbi:heat stress transcription factor B-4-like protein [Tanacetum coccineum]|uniref:Heat stress transcription factor B-4-like protein n=1 Tax=Tanacetum coccineum TaxID=301880 RepID=A0ABQ5D8C1_9ASTR